MKTKHAIILLVIGFCFDSIGALLKIMHHANAETFLIVGTALKVIGGLLFLFKLLTYPKVKEFLNW